MQRLDRRQLLKTAAAAGLGAAAGGLGIAEALPAAAASQTAGFAPRSAPSLAPIVPAGTVAEHFMGMDFKPNNVADGWTGLGTVQANAINGFTVYGVKAPLPQGSVITRIQFIVQSSDAAPATLYFNIFDPFPAGGFTVLLSQNSIPNTVGAQVVDMTMTPIAVDNGLGSYILYWQPGNATTNQLLYGARIEHTLHPGLTLFPDPRRCFGNGTTTLAEAFILNIDATQKVAAAGPTGVPAGAKAAFCAVQSYQQGIMTLYPTGTADTGIANWSVWGTPGQLQLLYMMVPLSSTGRFNIHNRFTDKQIYVDVWGYLV